MSDTPQVLLAHHLKALRLPTFLSEYDKLARQCATEGVDHSRYLLRLAELEMIDRERRTVERRIKEARFPAVKSLDSFDFTALPSLNKTLVLELARSEYVTRRENVIALGNSGTGKTHIALGLGLAACQKGLPVGFTTAAALVNELHEARDEKRLLRLQRQLAGLKLLIVDELGYVPLSPTGAELLFEVFSQRYARGSIIVTSNRRGGRPRIDDEVRDLIRRMSRDNPLWGAPRIHAELLMLGIRGGESTVGRYLPRRRQSPSQGWKTFLCNHAAGIASIDSFVVRTISFRLLYGLAILRHPRRRLVAVSVTSNPSAEWIAGQVTDAFPWNQALNI